MKIKTQFPLSVLTDALDSGSRDFDMPFQDGKASPLRGPERLHK